MRVDLPRCNLNTCKYFFDFNCYGENRYYGCPHAYLRELEIKDEKIKDAVKEHFNKIRKYVREEIILKSNIDLIELRKRSDYLSVLLKDMEDSLKFISPSFFED